MSYFALYSSLLMLCWTQDFNNRIGEELRKANIQNFCWPDKNWRKDEEDRLSDQGNKKLLVSILTPLTHPVISYIEIFSYIISYAEQGALSIINVTKGDCRIFKTNEKWNLLWKMQFTTVSYFILEVIPISFSL